MNGRVVVLIVLAAAIGFTPIATAGSDATKQRVAINMKFPQSTFVLTPLKAGALKRDSGTVSESGKSSSREVIRDGQKVGISLGGWTLTGKRGTLTFREQAEWVDSGYDSGCGIALGTWKVVRGTGDYAGIAGGGRSAWEALCRKWFGRQEGFLTVP